MPDEYRSETLKCTLRVAVTAQEGRALFLTYTFENGSAQNAYLFNLLFERIGDGPVFLTDANAVHVEADDGDVVLSQKIVPVPEGLKVEKPAVPCTTLVKPGERFQQTVALELPLRVRTPYCRYEEKDLADRPVLRKAFFELGFFLATREGESLGKKVKTSAGEAVYFYPFPQESQKLLRAGPFSQAVPVRLPRK